MKVNREPDGGTDTGAVSTGHTLQVRIRLIFAIFIGMCVCMATCSILCNMQYIHYIQYVLLVDESDVWSGFKSAFNTSRIATRPSNVHGRRAVLFLTILY